MISSEGMEYISMLPFSQYKGECDLLKIEISDLWRNINTEVTILNYFFNDKFQWYLKSCCILRDLKPGFFNFTLFNRCQREYDEVFPVLDQPVGR